MEICSTPLWVLSRQATVLASCKSFVLRLTKLQKAINATWQYSVWHSLRYEMMLYHQRMLELPVIWHTTPTCNGSPIQPCQPPRAWRPRGHGC
jgi:hypothetical protein